MNRCAQLSSRNEWGRKLNFITFDLFDLSDSNFWHFFGCYLLFGMNENIFIVECMYVSKYKSRKSIWLIMNILLSERYTNLLFISAYQNSKSAEEVNSVCDPLHLYGPLSCWEWLYLALDKGCLLIIKCQTLGVSTDDAIVKVISCF